MLLSRRRRASGLPYGISSRALLDVEHRNFYKSVEAELRRTGGDIVTVGERCDPRMFKWFLCGLSGLSARVVGGMRICARRFSPGVGVGGRKPLRISATKGCSKVVELDKKVCVYRAAVELHHDLGSVAVVQPTSSCMGNFARKCLQDSVLTLVRGSDEENILRRMFLVNSRNDSPSGGAGSKTSRLNLYSVEYALRRLGLSVAVVGATCMNRLQSGWLLGRWSLGQKDGRHVGAICWFTETAHAAPLTDEFFAAVQDSVPTASSDIIPPWELFDVGAPKKKGMGKAVSKRGAHLKRGS